MPLKKLVKHIQHGFLVLCLGYLVYALFNERESVARLYAAADLRYVLPALLLWPLCVLSSGVFAWQVLRSCGCSVEPASIFAIYLNRLPAKYLPGGIWQTVARVYDFNTLGVGRREISILVFYENFWTVFLAALVSALSLVISGQASIYRDIAWLMLVGCLVVPIVACLFRRNSFVLHPQHYLLLTFTGLAFWGIASMAFVLYLYAFGDIMAGQSILTIVTGYLFSYVIGFVSIFTPQGVGVFELVMTQLTDFSISANQAIILLAGFRVVVLLGDMLAWVGFQAITARKNSKKKQKS